MSSPLRRGAPPRNISRTNSKKGIGSPPSSVALGRLTSNKRDSLKTQPFSSLKQELQSAIDNKTGFFKGAGKSGAFLSKLSEVNTIEQLNASPALQDLDTLIADQVKNHQANRENVKLAVYLAIKHQSESQTTGLAANLASLGGGEPVPPPPHMTRLYDENANTGGLVQANGGFYEMSPKPGSPPSTSPIYAPPEELGDFDGGDANDPFAGHHVYEAGGVPPGGEHVYDVNSAIVDTSGKQYNIHPRNMIGTLKTGQSCICPADSRPGEYTLHTNLGDRGIRKVKIDQSKNNKLNNFNLI